MKFLFILVFTVITSIQLIAQSYSDAKAAYKSGKYAEAMDLCDQILKSSPDDGTKAQTHILLGQINLEFREYNDAIDELNLAKKLFAELGSSEGEAVASIYLGDTYSKSKSYSKAISSYKDALEYFEQAKEYKEASNLCGDIGNTYYSNKDTKNAILWFEKGSEFALKDNNTLLSARHLNSAGNLYSNYGDYDKAASTLKKALSQAKEANNKSLIGKIEKSLSTVEQNVAAKENSTTTFDQEEEAKDQEIMINLKDQHAKSLEEIESLSEEMQLAELKIKAQQDEYEKKLLEEQLAKLEIQKNLELSKANEEKTAAVLEQEKVKSEKQKLILLSSVAIGVLLLIVAVVLLVGYRNKQKRNQKLMAQNTLIAQQKDEINQQATEINESIEYAKQIHISILPNILSFTEKHNAFVYINPKDIVSGDIFWYRETSNAIYLSVADCTGHGVPGAFTSIIASGALNDAIAANSFAEPSQLLEIVDQDFQDKFQQNSEIKVGMDLAIIKIQKQLKTITYSGARNSLYLVRNNELIEFKGVRRSVSPNEKKLKPFTDEKITYLEGDELFLFSDGFPDQKGGPNNEKFFYQNFRDLLVACATQPMNQQEQFIGKSFNNWINKNEQLDDVTVVGMVL